METPNNQQQLVVVLGMHRSGTSAITRGLQVMGVSLGNKLMPPAADNKKGFWEDLDVVAINNEMLNFCGRCWHSIDPIQQIDVELLCDQGYLSRAIGLLQDKIVGHKRFAFKDPRTAKMLPFWIRVFATGNLDVRYILALRNPSSVAKSLAQRDQFSPEKSYLLWIDHMLTSLYQTNAQNIIVVAYDRLIRDSESELLRIASWLTTDLDHSELSEYRDEFIDEELCHSRFELADVITDSAAPALAKEIYGFLVHVSTDRDEIENIIESGQLKKWVEECERLRPILRFLDKQSLLIKNQCIRNFDLNQTLAERDLQISNLNQTLAKRDLQISKLNQTLAERDLQISSLKESFAKKCLRHFGALTWTKINKLHG